MPVEKAAPEIDEILKKLWEIDLRVFRSIKKIEKQKNIHMLKAEKARFVQISKSLNLEVRKLQSLSSKLGEGELKLLANRQIQYFKMLSMYCGSDGDVDISPNEVSKARDLAFNEALEVVKGLIDRLKE